MKLSLIAPKLQCHQNLSTLILNFSLIWSSNQLELLNNKQFSELNIQLNPLTFLRLMVKVQLKVNWSEVTPSKLLRLINKCQLKLKTLKLLVLISILINSDFNSVFKSLLMTQRISKRSDKNNAMFWNKESLKLFNLVLMSFLPAWVLMIWPQNIWLKLDVLV